MTVRTRQLGAFAVLGLTRGALSRSALARVAPVLVVLAAVAGPAQAQTMSGLPNALQGFSINREKPVQITSTTLEVRDKEKRATFIGNVLVAQGDTTMKSKTLDVYYEQQEAGSADAKPGQPGSGGSQQIRRLEAKGGVVVTQKEQTATGETGVFDMKSNTVMLLGSVVITQGPQVIRGERLTVDLTTGVSHVEGGVQGLFMPNRVPKPGEGKGEAKGTDTKSGETRAADGRSGDAKPDGGRGKDKDAPKPSAKSAPGQPLRLN
jgi:lipopolysaccharide export system protein LptA